jgi:hypothetical protein
MNRIRQLIPLVRMESSDVPGAIRKGMAFLWERRGDYLEGLEVTSNRVLDLFLEQQIYVTVLCGVVRKVFRLYCLNSCHGEVYDGFQSMGKKVQPWKYFHEIDLP